MGWVVDGWGLVVEFYRLSPKTSIIPILTGRPSNSYNAL
ncbi:hypothetical protein IJ22_30240 [Paenibacillus naphthalenovorans]|uniref:Uncharacterized protein n=1 Tax=Paenibacillus naphthalenovorans TaxID=162209 RepID=A0A0U2W7B5_9BACL|nr:hypothetical protein IJ22_30240 [Paenibacillus naphthalenovorans]